MTNRELAEKLRACIVARTCSRCPYFDPKNHSYSVKCVNAMQRDAADALANSETHVAALQKEIEKLREQLILRNDEVLHLREATKMVPQWVSVDERLPKTREDVLVYAYWHEAWQACVGWCLPGKHRWYVNVGSAGTRRDVAVTHWMPLPSTEWHG